MDIWVVLSTTLIPFSAYLGARWGFGKGYKSGAEHILGEWRKFNEEVGYGDEK